MSHIDAIALVREHGRSAASFQALAPGLRHWFAPERAAFVAFADLGDAWVAVGGAQAPLDGEERAMQDFAREGRAQRRRVRFFATERQLPPDSEFAALQIGELPVWDPRAWPRSLSSRMRGQLRRDLKNARVDVRMATPAELLDPRGPTRRGIDALIGAWLEQRKVAPMGFMVDVDPWHLAHERRFFVAEHQGSVVAALIAIPVCARGGWFLETMLRQPGASNGAVEMLFDLAMRTFAAEGCSYLTFGMCPLSGASWRPLKLIRRLSAGFYNYEGLRKFKGKLGPASWQPVYLVYPRGESRLLAVWDAARAFMPGGVLAFAWSTLVQRARDTARWLAYGTMLWTSVFAWVAQDHWFPSSQAKLMRVAVDVLTVAGLLALGRRFRRTRALAVMALTLSTFVVSALQLGALAHVGGVLERAIVAVGTLLPLFSSLFLFASRDRERRYAAEPPTPHALPTRLVLNRPTSGEGDL